MSICYQKLIQTQIQLEYDLTLEGDLIPRSGSTQHARVVFYQFETYTRIGFRYDIPFSIRTRLRELTPETLLGNPVMVCAVLSQHCCCERVWRGSSLTFQSCPVQGAFPDVEQNGTAFVVVKNGLTISSAWPARENEFASEVIVETVPDFQRRGYGAQVVSAWAHDVMSSGRVPFYSYESWNVASQALARYLLLVKFCDLIAYD